MMDRAKVFKKGALVRHRQSSETGLVMDYGIFHKGHRKFVPTDKDAADSVRVWKCGMFKTWPADEVEVLG